jgi:hypothetical protein
MLEDTPGITATTYGAELNALSGRGKRRLSGVARFIRSPKKYAAPSPAYSSANRPSAGLSTALQLRKEAGHSTGNRRFRTVLSKAVLLSASIESRY